MFSHFRKSLHLCEKCNYGTHSLPHYKEHLALHETGTSVRRPAQPVRTKLRKSVESTTRTTRARSIEERRRTLSAEAKETVETEDKKEIEEETKVLLDDVEDTREGVGEEIENNKEEEKAETDVSQELAAEVTNSQQPEAVEEEVAQKEKEDPVCVKVSERRSSTGEKDKSHTRRSSARLSRRLSSPARSPRWSPARSVSHAGDPDTEVPTTDKNDEEDTRPAEPEVEKEIPKLESPKPEVVEAEPAVVKDAGSPTRSPRSRCRVRKISKAVAAELENNTAIEHEDETDAPPAKKPRRKSAPGAAEETSAPEKDAASVNTSHLKPTAEETHETSEEVEPSTAANSECASDAVSVELSHDEDEEEDDDEEEQDDISQHIDTTSGETKEENVVRCKFCPFTLSSSNEDAEANLRKHEQYHFRKSKYSCKHCTYSSGRKLVIKKHLEILHGDPSGLVIQKPKSSVKFTGKKIKMSFSFVKKNAFFKPLGLASRTALAIEKEEKSLQSESKAHKHHTRAAGRRVSPRAKAKCPCCVPDKDGKRSLTCLQADKCAKKASDVYNIDNVNESPSPSAKKFRGEETREEPLAVFDDSGKKVALKCRHCPFQLPWNLGVTSRMHSHEACHTRSYQFACGICGWNARNMLVAKRHMALHPEAKLSDIIKKWGKQPNSESDTSKEKAGAKSVTISNLEIIKNLTQKARIIKANTQKNSVKYGSNTVGALLQRKKENRIIFKPIRKTIKEILNLKDDSCPGISPEDKDTAGAAKTVRALLDRSEKNNSGDGSSTDASKLSVISVPENDGTDQSLLRCQYCPFKVCVLTLGQTHCCDTSSKNVEQMSEMFCG